MSNRPVAWAVYRNGQPISVFLSEREADEDAHAYKSDLEVGPLYDLESGLDPQAVKRVVEAAQTIRASNAEWLSRCDYCGWPIADSVESGCTPDNCSMRPRPKPADADIKQGLRRLLDALASLERGKEDK